MVNLQDQLRDTSYCIVDSKVPYHSHLVSLWKKKLLITSKETINWVCVFILCSRLILRVWLLNVFIYLLRTVIKTEGNNPHNSCSQFNGKSIICKDTIYSIIEVLIKTGDIFRNLTYEWAMKSWNLFESLNSNIRTMVGHFL